MHAIIDLDSTTDLWQHAEIEVGSFRQIELSFSPHAGGANPDDVHSAEEVHSELRARLDK